MHDTPVISIIIPTYNSEATIGRCLKALLRINYPLKHIEIIIVDSSSMDKTMDIVHQFKTKYGALFKSFKIIVIKERGSSKARNIGIKNASGDFIFFLDSDVIVPPEAFKILLEHFNRDANVAIAGLPYVRDKLSIFEKALYYRWPKPYGYLDFVDMGAALVRKDLIRNLSFNEKLGLPWSTWENTEFCAKILRCGYKIVGDTRCVCRHLKGVRSTINKSLKGKGLHVRLFRLFKYYFTKVGPANLEVLKVAPKRWVLRSVAYAVLPPLAVVLMNFTPLSTLLLLTPVLYHYFECKNGEFFEKVIISLLIACQRTVVAYATLVEALRRFLGRVRL